MLELTNNVVSRLGIEVLVVLSWQHMRRVIGLCIVLRITYRIRFFAFGNSRGSVA
jgi:hypothetical protein